MATKACAYLRVSGQSQVDGDGFPRQLEAIAMYARKNGFEIISTYREEAVSGTALGDKRPTFIRMLADLLANGCRTIIVERLDRLAREYRVQEELLLYLMRKELTLISADTGEDITAAMNADPMRRFVVQLQGLLAELDKNLLVAKLKKARASKRAKGGFAGGNYAYGQCSERATPEEIERAMKERDNAHRIRFLRSMGYTFDQIRITLEAEGCPPRSGGTWQLSSIRMISLQKPLN